MLAWAAAEYGISTGEEQSPAVNTKRDNGPRKVHRELGFGVRRALEVDEDGHYRIPLNYDEWKGDQKIVNEVIRSMIVLEYRMLF